MSASIFDTIIENGEIIDGTGSDAFSADIGIRNGVIHAVGNLKQDSATLRINAQNRVVSPGFIDAHTHDDRALLDTPDMTPKINQGVTTVVTGNCGVSLAPLISSDPPPPLNLLGDHRWYRFAKMSDYFSALDKSPAAINSVALVGHSTLRAATMDNLSRAASAAETEQMGDLLEESMQAGCIGLSTGLAYPTASAAPTSEVIALAERLKTYNGIHATHMRDEEDLVVEAVEESLEIGRCAGTPTVISHHKACGKRNWGKTKKTLELISQAQKSQTVNFDVYPYIASSTVLLQKFISRAERVLITWSDPHPEVSGQDLSDIQSRWGITLDETVERLQPAGAIYFQMEETDLKRVMQYPGAMIGSDGLPHDKHPHPRLWGTFPRVLNRYCRELGLFSMEQAVHRMTGKPASVFGIANRGVIRKDACADLVIFEADNISDQNDFDAPRTPCSGIDAVFVNGEKVWDGKAWTGATPGKLLRKS